MTDFNSKVKRRLSIKESDTTFDEDVSDFVDEAVKSLSPIVLKEIAPFTTSLAKDTNIIDLSSFNLNIHSVRLLEVYDSSNTTYHPFEEYSQHGDNLILNYDWDEAKTIKLWCLAPYSKSDVPDELNNVVINWAISEFYSNLVGNSRKYNLYTQSSGARKADNMRDISDYYMNRGNQILIDRAKIRGMQ